MDVVGSTTDRSELTPSMEMIFARGVKMLSLLGKRRLVQSFRPLLLRRQRLSLKIISPVIWYQIEFLETYTIVYTIVTNINTACSALFQRTPGVQSITITTVR